MQLTPRYGDADPVLRCDLAIEPPGPAMVRQRQRLAAVLGELDAAQWATASRCDGWSVQDVTAHLASTNQFWSYSISSGLKGQPTTLLDAFDPVATPAQLVDAVRTKTPAETLADFLASNEQLGTVVSDLDDDGWSTLAEAPPGHLPIRLLVLHALWDAWIHERDIVLPLGGTPEVQPDEVGASLLYGAALGPAFLASTGGDRGGSLEVIATDPQLHFVIDLGPTAVVHGGAAPPDAGQLAGDAVDLVEAVSYRTPLEPFITADDRWMLDGLATAFDRIP